MCFVANGATKKEIGRAKEFIVKLLEGEMGSEMGTIHAADYMVSFVLRSFCSLYLLMDLHCHVQFSFSSSQRRFCSNLGMTNQEVKAAQEVVMKSEDLDIRSVPYVDLHYDHLSLELNTSFLSSPGGFSQVW